MRGRSRHGRPSSPPAESAALGARTQLRERRSGPKMPPPRRPRRQREPRNPLDLEPPQWLLETEEWRRGGEVVPSCVGGREGESRQEYWQRGKGGGAVHGVGGSTSGECLEDQRCCGSMVWGFLQDHNQIKDCSTDLGLCLQLGTTAVSENRCTCIQLIIHVLAYVSTHACKTHKRLYLLIWARLAMSASLSFTC